MPLPFEAKVSQEDLVKSRTKELGGALFDDAILLLSGELVRVLSLEYANGNTLVGAIVQRLVYTKSPGTNGDVQYTITASKADTWHIQPSIKGVPVSVWHGLASVNAEDDE